MRARHAAGTKKSGVAREATPEKKMKRFPFFLSSRCLRTHQSFYLRFAIYTLSFTGEWLWTGPSTKPEMMNHKELTQCCFRVSFADCRPCFVGT